MQIPDDHTDKIPGVDTDSKPMLLKPNVGVGADFESPLPQEMPLVETSATEKPPTPKSIQASDGVCGSTRVSNKPVNWNISSWAGQKFSFATTQLGRSLLKDDDYQHDPLVAFAFMQQMLLKVALKQWGSDAEKAGMKEVNQLHWKDTFFP